MQLSINQLNDILKTGGASLEFTTGEPTKKQGFFVSLEDTETTFSINHYKDNSELLKAVNEALNSNTYNAELNKGHLLGFWIDNGRLFMDVSKCMKATKKDLYKVKNEALINNQYAVYNNELDKTYNLILPIYTLYNTADLLGEPTTSLNTYSKDFYHLEDVAEFLGIKRTGASEFCFDSIDSIPVDYNQSKVIIKDTSNYTRDLLDIDETLTIETAYKLSRLIEAV